VKATAAWDWSGFQGSAPALKYARRDLPNLRAVIKLTPRHRVCLQAGGNLGIWPKALATAFESVFTCEPDADNYDKLRTNAPEKNIHAYPYALGETSGAVGLSRVRRDGKPTSHEGCVHVDGAGTVPMATIDEFELPVCDLIYLDVEGYELFALRGARATLARCRPVVAVEINKHLRSYGLTELDVLTFMEAAGYRSGPRVGCDQVFLPEAA